MPGESPDKIEHIKTKYMKNIIAIVAFAALTIGAQADNHSNWVPPTYSKNLVTSKAQADDCCKAGATLNAVWCMPKGLKMCS